ncbi:GrpB family protein [Vibrio pomeroyi]|uniref:GrpB family protein n=1 Tax=Vibrio pomeroyi TaxID=198832 RepID=UPI0029056CC4|nr:GrpB family protein [Vibrio pomeroyi]
MKFYPAEQYQTACHEMFARYERDIKKLIPNARVEHVGASSIPSALSKGDLDIFVGIESSELEYAAEQLTTLGFKEKLDTLRTPELCMLESTSGDDVALQVVGVYWLWWNLNVDSLLKLDYQHLLIMILRILLYQEPNRYKLWCPCNLGKVKLSIK